MPSSGLRRSENCGAFKNQIFYQNETLQRSVVECVTYRWCAMVSITEWWRSLLFECHRAVNVVLIALTPIVWRDDKYTCTYKIVLVIHTHTHKVWGNPFLSSPSTSPSSGRGTLSSGVYPIAARPSRFIHLQETSEAKHQRIDKNKSRQDDEKEGWVILGKW